MFHRLKMIAKLVFAIGLLILISYIAGAVAFRLGWIIGHN